MILVVDDEKSVRVLVRKILERAGYHVAEADGAVQALAILHNGIHARLMLTDIVMPGMSGLALAAEVHQRHPELPVIFMTAFASQYQEELTGTVCLRKPFKPVELLTAVEGVIGLPGH